MIAIYEMTEKDVKEIGLQPIENAASYFGFQSGYNYRWGGIYAKTYKDNVRYDVEVLNASNMTEEIEKYIYKNCTCKEFE